MECEQPDCGNQAAVRLHVPGADNLLVCPDCARALAQQEGVVPEPLEGKEDEWP